MKIIYIPSSEEILDFETRIGVELVAYEREKSYQHLSRFYVSFEGAEFKDTISSPFLMAGAGNGNTINEALKDYCSIISNKILVLNSANPQLRTQIQVPSLVHTKILNK